MDHFIGNVIDDITLFRILQSIIVILSMFTVYLGIQIALTWNFLKKDGNSDKVISQKGSFIRSCVFISITGFFMLFHEFFEGIGEFEPDSTTYEFFELVAFSGLVLFLYEWYSKLTKIKKRQRPNNSSDVIIIMTSEHTAKMRAQKLR